LAIKISLLCDSLNCIIVTCLNLRCNLISILGVIIIIIMHGDVILVLELIKCGIHGSIRNLNLANKGGQNGLHGQPSVTGDDDKSLNEMNTLATRLRTCAMHRARWDNPQKAGGRRESSSTIVSLLDPLSPVKLMSYEE
jgi:hypothetical protein